MSYGTDAADMFHQVDVYTGNTLRRRQAHRFVGHIKGTVNVQRDRREGAHFDEFFLPAK